MSIHRDEGFKDGIRLQKIIIKPAHGKWQTVARGLGALSLIYGLILGGTAIWSHLHAPPTLDQHNALAFKRINNLTELQTALKPLTVNRNVGCVCRLVYRLQRI